MTNREYYKDKILDLACAGDNFAIKKNTNIIISCSSIDDCINCEFRNLNRSCSDTKKEWCDSEYIERPKLTRNEKMFLDILSYDWQYIARDSDGSLRIYQCKPIKKYEKSEIYGDEILWKGKNFLYIADCKILFKDVLFSFIKSSDNEPWLISDLKKLEVIE